MRRVVRVILGGTARALPLPKTAGAAATTACAGATRIDALRAAVTAPGCICWLMGTLRGLRSGDACVCDERSWGGEAGCGCGRGDRETLPGIAGRTDGVGGGALVCAVTVLGMAGERARVAVRAGACPGRKSASRGLPLILPSTLLTKIAEESNSATVPAGLLGLVGDGTAAGVARVGADAVCRTARAARGALRDTGGMVGAAEAVLLSVGFAEDPAAPGRVTATRGLLAVKVAGT